MNDSGYPLGFLYWLHMLATLTWLGMQAALVLWVLPLGKRYLPSEEKTAFVSRTLKQVMPWEWFSALVLLATGMFQMSANPYYGGFLAISNRWAYAILGKHIVYGLMLTVNGTLSMVFLPRLERAALLLQHGRPAPDAPAAARRTGQLLWLNLGMGVLVLALTALARAA
ncbi:MAG TPA: hypothetical protein ENJ02_10760 [Chloroflexi bacterium]|nr:hypothetical protein [Chloroflexota bacterium]